MSEMYDALAPIYDALNSEINYETWADFIVSEMQKHATRSIHTIADIGCGTGSMTIPLAHRGYEMLGIDLSSEMLNVAYMRALDVQTDAPIRFVMQDMTSLDLGGEMDAVVCILDGLNHLAGRDALRACFTSVAAHLAEGGVFLFDLNSRHKFEHVYAEQTYTFETADSFCVWQNQYHASGKFCDFFITLFEENEEGLYTRSDTMQREYYFSMQMIKNALKDAGLTLVSCVGGLDGHDIKKDDERWYFTALKG